MSNCKKLRLILWKNWLFRRRHYVVTAFELILPTLFAVLLYTLKNKGGEAFKVTYVDKFQVYNPENFLSPFPEYAHFNFYTENISFSFLYSPDTNFSLDLLKYLPDYLEKKYKSGVKIIGVKDEETIERMAFQKDLDDNQKLVGAVVFVEKNDKNVKNVKSDKNVNLNDQIPNSLYYKIRITDEWSTSLLESPINLPGPNFLKNMYLSNKLFLVYQHLIAIRYTEILTNKDDLLSQINITVEKFPHPPYYEDSGFSQIMTVILPLFINLSYLFTAPTIIKRIVREKETGIRELMKMMGLPNWIQWFGWFVSNFIMMAISAIIIVALLCVGSSNRPGVLGYSAPELVYIIMLLYISSAICFCFFITSFFSKPSIATGVAVIIWIVSFCVPYYTKFADYHKLCFSSKMSLALLPNMAMAWAVRIMAGLEGKKSGIQWYNLNEPSVVGDNLTMVHVFLIFFVDIALYSLLTWYFDHVLPGEYGVPKPWYFLFTKAYWVQNKSSIECETSEIEDSDKIEPEPVGLSPVIVIKKLTKSFGANKIAVDHLSLKIYEGQITALLGHNGAGKTTTMSMLTGMYSPTSGTAIINGYDIRTEMDVARNDLGLCPQHNMLFDKLTVQEHLIFFGKLKENSEESLSKDIDSLLKKLQLWEKRNDFAMNLSGGMKRKLNLGIALIGGSKIVMLDEPTSGIDPEARRAIWDLLQEYRTGRCILLSTHFMEEADILGDRIAIMARGQIECCGTPLFLKKRYGAGYHLTLNITNNDEMMNISNMIHRCVPTSYLENNTEGELSFVLPPNESHRFVSLFEQLETNAESLGIKNFGLSVTTLEEVFLKVGETLDEKNTHQENSNHDAALIIEPENATRREVQKNTGVKLWFQQFFGLLLKHYYYAIRRPSLLIAQILVPVVIAVCLLLTMNDIEGDTSSHEPPLLMDISQYGSTVSFTNYDQSNEQIASLGKSYESSFPSTTTVERVNDSLTYLKEVGQHDYVKFRSQLVTGADFQLVDTSNVYINIWFNDFYFHSLPLGLNLVHNAIVKKYTKNEKYSISVENAPHPSFHKYYSFNGQKYNVVMPIIIGLLIPIGLSMLSASFVIFPIQERASKCKHLQFMTGINGFIFWLSSFIWDFTVHFFSSCLILLVFDRMDKTDTFIGENKPGIVLFILFLFGWCSVPFTYLNSFIFRVPASGFVFVTIVNLVSGIILSLWIFLTEAFTDPYEDSVVSWACYLLPNFAVTVALMKFVFTSTQNNACKKVDSLLLESVCSQPGSAPNFVLLRCCSPDVCGDSCFKPNKIIQKDFPGIEKDLVMMTVDGFLFLLILFVLETSFFRRFANYLYTKVASFRKIYGVVNGTDSKLDEDVVAEKERVRMLVSQKDQSSDLFVAQNLKKQFWSIVAVDDLNFGVENGKCFGLLGINGAGKTTTFQMLTGDLFVTTGNIFVKGFNLNENRSQYLINISYCPQFDALIDHLSGREMLTVFAHLNGIPTCQSKEIIDSFLTKFDLTQHANKITLNYSGGNKRKLSAAMAFIGHTPVVFLDEPTTGVDPTAKRKIWTNIRDANNSGTSIVLTSHSMEECEVLCSRVAIMVNGQFQCIGGIQYLKNKFSQGFTILAKMKRNSTDSHEMQVNTQKELQHFIEEKFSSASLKDVHQGLIHYQVTDVTTKWTYLFSTMEEAKVRFDLEDYSVSQATLEQVFLSFARKQRIVATT